MTRFSGAMVRSISCPAPGECAAGGFYNSSKRNGYEPFVVSQTNGSWGTAVEVAGAAMLGQYPGARLNAISCAAPGECAAAGSGPAFVVSETDGKWGSAIKVPGVGSVDEISCAAPGECVAGGNYNRDGAPFFVTERNGSWGKAVDVPGIAKLPGVARLSSGWSNTVTSVSCAAAGECAAGGYDYYDRNGKG